MQRRSIGRLTNYFVSLHLGVNEQSLQHPNFRRYAAEHYNLPCCQNVESKVVRHVMVEIEKKVAVKRELAVSRGVDNLALGWLS
jgi:hypothetical protein